MTAPEKPAGGWTLEAYVIHNEAMRAAEVKLQCERERRYAQVKEAESKALKMQAEKDQKHFEDLNHEQARLLADRERYLPRETYAADRKDKSAMALAYFAIGLEIVVAGVAAFLTWWSKHQ